MAVEDRGGVSIMERRKGPAKKEEEGANDERPTIYKYFRKRFVVWPKVEVEEEEENLTRN